eukprot:UN3807
MKPIRDGVKRQQCDPEAVSLLVDYCNHDIGKPDPIQAAAHQCLLCTDAPIEPSQRPLHGGFCITEAVAQCPLVTAWGRQRRLDGRPKGLRWWRRSNRKRRKGRGETFDGWPRSAGLLAAASPARATHNRLDDLESKPQDAVDQAQTEGHNSDGNQNPRPPREVPGDLPELLLAAEDFVLGRILVQASGQVRPHQSRAPRHLEALALGFLCRLNLLSDSQGP